MTGYGKRGKPKAGFPRSGVGVRQQTEPLAQERIDLLRTESVADGLQPSRFVATQHTVVQCLESDVLFRQLLFGILMPVDTQLGRVREVAAEFQKKRAEFAIHAVDIELVHHRG
jgi:hypothetical protein